MTILALALGIPLGYLAAHVYLRLRAARDNRDARQRMWDAAQEAYELRRWRR